MVFYPTRAQIPGEANVQYSYHTALNAKLHPGADCVGSEAGLHCSSYGSTRRKIGGDIGDPVLMQRSWLSSGHVPSVKTHNNKKTKKVHPTMRMKPQRTALPSRSQQMQVNLNEQDRLGFLNKKQMPVGYTGIASRSSRMEAAQNTRNRYDRATHSSLSASSYGSYGQ